MAIWFCGALREYDYERQQFGFMVPYVKIIVKGDSMSINGLSLSAPVIPSSIVAPSPIAPSMSNELLRAQHMVNSGTDGDFESMLVSALNEKDEEKLKDACTQFEELMIGMIYKQMKATVIRANEEEKDPGRDIYEQWQDDALVKEMAKNGSFGLADMMFRQLTKHMKNEYILNEE